MKNNTKFYLATAECDVFAQEFAFDYTKSGIFKHCSRFGMKYKQHFSPCFVTITKLNLICNCSVN